MERDHSFWPSTEVGLIRRLENADDDSAWAVFVERYRAPIRRTALRAGLSDTQAEEVVQNTWLAVLKSLATYNPQLSRFRTWLGGIVRNRIREQVRGPKGEPLQVQASPDSTTCLERQHPDLIEDPYLPFEEEEERELDTRAWERLKREISLRHWQVLYDLVAHGRSVKEVANKYGYRPITVYVIKQRDLPKLKKGASTARSRGRPGPGRTPGRYSRPGRVRPITGKWRQGGACGCRLTATPPSRRPAGRPFPWPLRPAPDKGKGKGRYKDEGMGRGHG